MKKCGVCGFSCDWQDGRYFSFGEIKEQYRVGFVDICGMCGDKANSFICYYGEKSQKDLMDLHRFLVSGVAPMSDFFAMMNAGYEVAR